MAQKLEIMDETRISAHDFESWAGIRWGGARRDFGETENSQTMLASGERYTNSTINTNRPPRPGTAPAIYAPARSSHYVGPEIISRTSTAGSGSTAAIPSDVNGLGPGTPLDMELLEDSPFAFNVPEAEDFQKSEVHPLSSKPISIASSHSQFPNATVWDGCGSWP